MFRVSRAWLKDSFAARGQGLSAILLQPKITRSQRRQALKQLVQQGHFKQQAAFLTLMDSCIKKKEYAAAIDVLYVFGDATSNSNSNSKNNKGMRGLTPPAHKINWSKWYRQVLDIPRSVEGRLKAQQELDVVMSKVTTNSSSPGGIQIDTQELRSGSRSRSFNSSDEIAKDTALAMADGNGSEVATHDGYSDAPFPVAPQHANTKIIGSALANGGAIFAAKTKQVHITPNASFNNFYLQQRVAKTDLELTRLVQALQIPPQKALRIDSGNPCWPLVVEQAHQTKGLRPLSWYPNDLCWVLDEKSSEAEQVHARSWFSRITARNLGKFQSQSSLLPPLFLNPKMGDKVLDMCAAPASKTTEILDLMKAGGAESNTAMLSLQGAKWATNPTYGSGVVIASDFDSRRYREMMERVGTHDPAVGFLRGDATKFPNLADSSAGGGGGGAPSPFFNKVLCDAECSGDGLLHKDIHRWRMWHPRSGVELFHKQVRLLRRAVEVSKPGSSIVYSTCTMNPLENEAVVAAMVRLGLVEVLPAPQHLAMEVSGGNGFTPGMPSWAVPAQDGKLYREFEESKRSGFHDPLVTPHHFPPQDPVHQQRRAAEHGGDETFIKSQLARCCRIYPHLHYGMDGFFIAHLRSTGKGLKRHQQSSSSSSQKSIYFSNGRNVQAVYDTHEIIQRDILERFGLRSFPPDAGNGGGSSTTTQMVVQRSLQAHQRAMIGGKITPTSSSSPMVAQPLSEGDKVMLVGSNVLKALESPVSTAIAVGEADSDRVAPLPFTPVLDVAGLHLFTAVRKRGELEAELTERGAAVIGIHAKNAVLDVPFSMLQMLFARDKKRTPGDKSNKANGLNIDTDFLDQRKKMLNYSEDDLPPLAEHETWVREAQGIDAGTIIIRAHRDTKGYATSQSASSVDDIVCCIPGVLTEERRIRVGAGVTDATRASLQSLFAASSSKAIANKAKQNQSKFHLVDPFSTGGDGSGVVRTSSLGGVTATAPTRSGSAAELRNPGVAATTHTGDVKPSERLKQLAKLTALRSEGTAVGEGSKKTVGSMPIEPTVAAARDAQLPSPPAFGAGVKDAAVGRLPGRFGKHL